ncbi:MAG TPA: HupE/UreJ family protein, partial [Methylocella sp.]|nr:HupE/UreJ family protein [Methylocella sp.]
TRMNLLPRRKIAAALLWIAALGLAPAALGHAAGYGYLKAVFEGDALSGQLELAIRDFDFAFFDLAFGGPGGKPDLGQLHRKEPEIAALLLSKIAVGPPGSPCSLSPGPIAAGSRGGEPYLIVPFSGTCPTGGGEIEVAYDLMFDIDPQHRALADIRRGAEHYESVLTPGAKVIRFAAGSASLSETAGAYIIQGAHHIWIGYDHILFLVTLLLPAVLVRTENKWQPADGFASAFWSTLKVVTAFTLAHSITLSVAAFGIVELPSRFVESAIAASVVVAAVNNLYPVITRRLWVVAFAFGLVHGFGFASVLNEFGLPPDRKLAALVAFNIGVELGQLAIVVTLLPVLFLARRKIAYARVVMPAGSAAISVIALIWLIERASGTSLLFG